MVLYPVIDNGNDSVGHGEGCDRAWFFDSAGNNIKNFVSALAMAGWAKEDSWEQMKLHGICNCRIIVGFDIGAQWGDALFG